MSVDSVIRGYDLNIHEFNKLQPKKVKLLKDTPAKLLKNISLHKVYEVVSTFQDMAVIVGDDGNSKFIDKQHLLIKE
jgi:hypothetical protein